MPTLSITTKDKKETQTVITILGALGIVVKETEENVSLDNFASSLGYEPSVLRQNVQQKIAKNDTPFLNQEEVC